MPLTRETLMPNVDHPLYQYRHVMPDGTQRIAIVWEGKVQDYEHGRGMVFGYWRPGSFTVLTKLDFEDEVKVIGLQNDLIRWSAPATVAPDMVLGSFQALAEVDERYDRQCREASIARRDADDALYWSSMRVAGGIVWAQDEVSIRKMLDDRVTIDFGIVDRASGKVPKPMARLSFSDGLTITFSGIAVERWLTFDPDSARDLDRVALAWMDFTQRVRDDAHLASLFDEVRAA